MSRQGRMSRSVNTIEKICFFCGWPGHVMASCPGLIREGYGHGHNWYNRGPVHGSSIRKAKYWQRNGDWLCPTASCGNINFAFRSVCNRCGAVRFSSVSGVCDGKGSQMVTVQMTVDDLKKWYQVKGIEQGDKKICEATAVPAKDCGNVLTSVGFDRKGAPWLIDSGASRHMAGSYREFDEYFPEIGNQSVKLADGSAQSIMGSGKVICNPDLSLSSMLHVPTFPINLMSISCITKELNCAAIFYPTWCLFLELGTWKILGTGKLRDGLYYLDDNVSVVAAATISQSPLQEFLLHHRRLGHMSFNTLGQLYPDLFNKVQTTKQGEKK